MVSHNRAFCGSEGQGHASTGSFSNNCRLVFYFFYFFAGRVTSFGHSPWSYNVKFSFFYPDTRSLWCTSCQVRMSMLGDLVRSVLSLQWSGPVKNYWFLAQGYVVFKKCFCFSSRNRRHFKVRCVIFTTLGSANRRSPNRLLKRGTKKAIINGENLYNHLQDLQLLKTPLHCIIISKLDFTGDIYIYIYIYNSVKNKKQRNMQLHYRKDSIWPMWLYVKVNRSCKYQILIYINIYILHFYLMVTSCTFFDSSKISVYTFQRNQPMNCLLLLVSSHLAEKNTAVLNNIKH